MGCNACSRANARARLVFESTEWSHSAGRLHLITCERCARVSQRARVPCAAARLPRPEEGGYRLVGACCALEQDRKSRRARRRAGGSSIGSLHHGRSLLSVW